MMDRADYRERIYRDYASRFQGVELQFDAEKAERWGGAYDTFLRGWLPARKDVEILEAACGGGNFLHFLKQRGYERLTGVDVSPQQSALARQVDDNVHEADALEFLESTDQTFDLIVALDLVEHLHKEEVLRFLDGCFAALRTGGRIVLQTTNAESAFGAAMRYGDFTHEVSFTAKSLGHLLEVAGFEAAEARETGPVVRGVASALRYLAWRCIRLGIKIWNLAETGSAGGGILSRVFQISAVKPEGNAADER